MPKVKSVGNMYEWVNWMHTHLEGECPHKCIYCYVQTGMSRMSKKWKGELRFNRKELEEKYEPEGVYFIEHKNDLFADEVDQLWIQDIICHCLRFPKNKYVFQTKNPTRAWKVLDGIKMNFMIGTTIETNRDISAISKAPLAHYRKTGIAMFYGEKETFVTIEPIMDFDPDEFVQMIVDARPSFVNIGADSKRCNLHEPSADKIRMLIRGLQGNGVKILKKVNLERIVGKL